MGKLNQSALAEQWLADLEAKAKAYKSSSTYERLIAKDEFIAAANPAAVLRLVAMVRRLAANFPGVVRPCAGFSSKCALGDITKCEGDADAKCWITAAYAATENRHDQD